MPIKTDRVVSDQQIASKFILDRPVHAMRQAFKVMKDDVEFLNILRTDLDVHQVIADRLLGRKATRKQRTDFKESTFCIFYGGFGKVSKKVLNLYRVHMPALVRHGEKTNLIRSGKLRTWTV